MSRGRQHGACRLHYLLMDGSTWVVVRPFIWRACVVATLGSAQAPAQAVVQCPKWPVPTRTATVNAPHTMTVSFVGEVAYLSQQKRFPIVQSRSTLYGDTSTAMSALQLRGFAPSFCICDKKTNVGVPRYNKHN